MQEKMHVYYQLNKLLC